MKKRVNRESEEGIEREEDKWKEKENEEEINEGRNI